MAVIFSSDLADAETGYLRAGRVGGRSQEVRTLAEPRQARSRQPAGRGEWQRPRAHERMYGRLEKLRLFGASDRQIAR